MDYLDDGGREAMEILDELKIMIQDAKGSFGNQNKCTIERNEALNLIDDVFAALPRNLRDANIIVRQNDDIRFEAEQEAERIIEDARKQAEILASEKEVVRVANIQAETIVEDANRYARETRDGVDDYADEVFYFVETSLDNWLVNVRANRERFVDTSGM